MEENMQNKIVIPQTELSLCPIGLGTVGAGLDWDGTDADLIFNTYMAVSYTHLDVYKRQASVGTAGSVRNPGTAVPDCDEIRRL